MNIGDKVYLKSGSPELTVTDISDEDGRVTVAWPPNGAGQFNPATLTSDIRCTSAAFKS